jgi:hypothetical protein
MMNITLKTEMEFSLLALPLDLLGEISRFLTAVDVINVKFVCRLIKSKMERGGLASFIIADYDWAPKSTTWLNPIINSRLTELNITCRTKPHIPLGVACQLPSSMRRLSLNFEGSMGFFFEPLPTTPGVTKSLKESYKLMNMDSYFPNLAHLSLIDKALSWKLMDNEPPMHSSAAELSSFISHLPPSLSHLELAPFPSLNGVVSDLPRLISFHLHNTPQLHQIDLPSSLTALHITAGSFIPHIAFQELSCLKELVYNVTATLDPNLPDTLEILRFLAGYFVSPLPFPKGLTEVDFGQISNPEEISVLLPSTLQKLTMDTTIVFDLGKLPRSLKVLCTGSMASNRFRLGFSDNSLQLLPPGLESLVLVGRQRITHECWFYLPKTLRILKIPDHSVNSAFIKLIPHDISEIAIGLLLFSFKEGIALIEDTPLHMEIPKSLENSLLSKLVPKHVIFTLKRSECDLKDSSATLLPPDLTSLTILGSQVGITDEFVRFLPRKLAILRMPNQMNFTSRIISLLPKTLHTLELDGHGIPDDIILPPNITSTTFTSSASSVEQRRQIVNKAPK